MSKTVRLYENDDFESWTNDSSEPLIFIHILDRGLDLIVVVLYLDKTQPVSGTPIGNLCIKFPLFDKLSLLLSYAPERLKGFPG